MKRLLEELPACAAILACVLLMSFIPIVLGSLPRYESSHPQYLA